MVSIIEPSIFVYFNRNKDNNRLANSLIGINGKQFDGPWSSNSPIWVYDALGLMPADQIKNTQALEAKKRFFE